MILRKVEMASAVELYEYESCFGCGKVIVQTIQQLAMSFLASRRITKV
ncbi:hypothetical protein [Bacillus sp. SA1-12]|nr:hypothetical protein [Bacillus sp. SA1-12]